MTRKHQNPGALDQPGVQNKEDCLELCAHNVRCYGVNVDNNNRPVCWFLLEPVDQTRPLVDNDAMDVYVLNERCPRHGRVLSNADGNGKRCVDTAPRRIASAHLTNNIRERCLRVTSFAAKLF